MIQKLLNKFIEFSFRAQCNKAVVQIIGLIFSKDSGLQNILKYNKKLQSESFTNNNRIGANSMREFPMNFRFSVIIARILFTTAIYGSVFYDFGFIDVLCGPLAVPPDRTLFIWVLIIELLNISYGLILMVLFSTYRTQFQQKIAKSYYFKYIVLFFLKLSLILLRKTHRTKYYFHSILIEAILLLVIFIFDLTNNRNLLQIVQLTLFDLLNKVSIFYQLTRTFCPKFALYWFISNMMFLILSQIQSYVFENKQKLTHTPRFQSSLYVKQDTHKLLLFYILFFGLFSFFQIEIYGYGMLVVFIVTFWPYYMAADNLKQNRSLTSIAWMLVVTLCITGFVYLRINSPTLFKALYREGQQSQLCRYGYREALEI